MGYAWEFNSDTEEWNMTKVVPVGSTAGAYWEIFDRGSEYDWLPKGCRGSLVDQTAL